MVVIAAVSGREILEIYDWERKDPRWPNDSATENYRKFRFYPRFVRNIDDNGKELLSLCKVLEYLMESDQLLVDDDDLLNMRTCSHDGWLKFTEKVSAIRLFAARWTKRLVQEGRRALRARET